MKDRTGGHTYPALTAIRTLQARLAAAGRSLDVLWVGTADGLEARVAPAEGIPFVSVATGKVRRSANPLKMISAANVKDMGRVPLGAAQARSIIADFRPDVVLATGGYVAVPVGLAAKVCGRPLVVHEQTVRLDLANRVLAIGADQHGGAGHPAVAADRCQRHPPVRPEQCGRPGRRHRCPAATAGRSLSGDRVSRA
ncbi:hypothetical protein GCM10009664_57120 [Kitasatospora gansuensis]